MSTADRRKHPRLSIAVDVDFKSGHNFFTARTRDISSGGLFIESDAPVPVGMRIEIDLSFLKSHVRVPAEVAWTLEEDGRCVGMGVRFIDLRPAARKSIEAFMALRSPLQCGEVVEAEAATPPPLPSGAVHAPTADTLSR
ncbi:MAG TPA: PilZ domain-containing protein [Polyangiaceae bacterium]